MDDAIPVGELSSYSPGAQDSSPSLRKLQFDGLRACNGADSAMKGGDLGGGAAGSNAARYRLMTPARLPISRPPPCLTIPPGFSPTALLDSPVLLSHVKAEPSPTTGTLSASMVVRDAVKSEALPAHSLNSYEGSREFELKPQSRLASVSGLSPSEEMNNKDDAKVEGHTNSAVLGDQIKSASLALVEKSSEDGYNWRKYGQKHVKGSEFPRSYYKCTHPNCEVKKQLERSHDGRITEILYKGKHDHPKPEPSRRLGVGAIASRQKDESSDVFRSATKEKHGFNISADTLSNGVSAVQDNDPCASPNFSPLKITGGVGVESVDTSTATSANEDDSDLKRRKIDNNETDMASAGKMARDQRVVVQTVSEVDILDDGYRWRKYGQKVVKGNPNPRSYYKCTNAGCQVRKHVERASHDPKAVITTYEGKHNHDVPSSKTNDHNGTGSTADNKFSSHVYARPISVAVPDHHHSEKNDIVSLDLGVGVTSNFTDPTSEAQLSLENQQLRIQMQISTPGDT